MRELITQYLRRKERTIKNLCGFRSYEENIRVLTQYYIALKLKVELDAWCELIRGVEDAGSYSPEKRKETSGH